MYKSIGPYELNKLNNNLKILLEAKKYNLDKNIIKLRQGILPLQEAFKVYYESLNKYNLIDHIEMNFNMLDLLSNNSVITISQLTFLKDKYHNLFFCEHYSSNYRINIEILNYFFHEIISKNFNINIHTCYSSEVCDYPDEDIIKYLPCRVEYYNDIKTDYISEWQDSENYSEELNDLDNFFIRVFSEDAAIFTLKDFCFLNDDLVFFIDELINDNNYEDEHSEAFVGKRGTSFILSDGLISNIIPLELLTLIIIGCFESAKGGLCTKI